MINVYLFVLAVAVSSSVNASEAGVFSTGSAPHVVDEPAPADVSAKIKLLADKNTAEWINIRSEGVFNISVKSQLEDAESMQNGAVRSGSWGEDASSVSLHMQHRTAQKKYDPQTFMSLGRLGNPSTLNTPPGSAYAGFILHDEGDQKVEGSWTHAYMSEALGAVVVTEIDPEVNRSTIRLRREFSNAEVRGLPAILYVERSRESAGEKRVTNISWIEDGRYFEASAEIDGTLPIMRENILNFLSLL